MEQTDFRNPAETLPPAEYFTNNSSDSEEFGSCGATSYSMDSRPPVAVIVGLEANGLGVARSLARQGIAAIALASPWANPCCYTNACTGVRGSAWSADGVVSDLLSIGSRLEAKAPLLLTKDQSVLWISEARNELSQFFEIALPAREIVDLLMSKVQFVRLAQSEGWPVPHTWMIESKDSLMAVCSEIPCPCILKPQVKNDAFRRNSPKKAFRINSRQHLLQTYDLVAAWEKEVVIQELVEGGDDSIGFCLGYCDRNSSPRALFSGRKLIQWPGGWGNTAVSEPAPVEWRGPMEKLTKEIWQKVGYKGLGSIEYKMRLGTNTPVIIEPTVGRTDFQSELAALNGVNIPAIAYYDLAGMAAPTLIEPREITKLVDGPSHLKAARVFMSSPTELGLHKWLAARKGRKRYMVLRAGDYRPFLNSIYVQARAMFGGVLEKLVGTRRKRKLTAKATR